MNENAVLKAPWDRVTLASLATGAAATHGTRLFMADCPDRTAWEGDEPRQLGFAEFARRAQFLARQLQTLGLVAGERILLLLANTVELPVSIVAVRMAGMVPVVAPLTETQDSLRALVERLGVAAILTCPRVETLPLAEKARQIAARALCVRAIAGFGRGLPEGIVPLDGWSEEDVDPLAGSPAVSGGSTALITLMRRENRLVAYARSEAQLIAEALAFGARARLDREAGLIFPMQPGSAAALLAGLVAPLLLGMPVQLVGPFTSGRLAAALAACPGAALVAPAPIMTRVRMSHGVGLGPFGGLVTIRRPADPPDLAAPLSDVAEIALLDLDEAATLPLGAWPASGLATLDGEHAHPVEDVLPDGMSMISFRALEGRLQAVSGFCLAHETGHSQAASDAA